MVSIDNLVLMNYNQIYHVYNHAIAFEDLFKDEFCYSIFLNRLTIHITPYADILAFCLMPNHFHLVVKIRSEDEVKAAAGFLYNPVNRSDRLEFVKGKMQQLDKNPSLFFSRRFSDCFNSYSKTINKIYNRKGSLFIKNFKRKIVDSDSYLTHLIYYVHVNPVRHELRKNINQWQWCSYKSYFKDDFSFVETSHIIDHFGGLEMFLEHHNKPYRRPSSEDDDHDTEVGFLSHFKYF